MKKWITSLIALLCAATPVFAAGHVFNENFSVLTPEINGGVGEGTRLYADLVMQRAEHYRKEISQEWFGQELPTGIGRTHINVSFGEGSSLTWPDRKGNLHRVFIKAPFMEAFDAPLKHEICHVVFRSRYPRVLPAWIEEGIASRYDDQGRRDVRRELLRWWHRTGNWPNIRDLLYAERIPTNNPRAYAVSVSLVDYLLRRDDRERLLRFAQAARANFQDALATHYEIHSVGQLQGEWQQHVRETNRAAQVPEDEKLPATVVNKLPLKPPQR